MLPDLPTLGACPVLESSRLARSLLSPDRTRGPTDEEGQGCHALHKLRYRLSG